MRRIGLFGGSFDPVHLGHLLVAETAVEELGLSRLYFIPAAQSPFKPESKPAPASERLKLLRLALAGCPWAQIDDQEVRRGGISYTVDTLREYARRFSDSELYYMIGADHIAQLPMWKAADELAQLARFAVIPRPGKEQSPLPPPFQGKWLQGFPIGLSSSQIRARVKAGLAIDHLVPPAVAEAVANSGLYL